MGGSSRPGHHAPHTQHSHAPRDPMLPFVHAQALSTLPTRLRQQSTRRAPRHRCPHSDVLPRVGGLRRGLVRVRLTALSRHPTLAPPAAHARPSILQALTPPPLLTRARGGSRRSHRAARPRRGVGWLWAVVFAPRFTATARARWPARRTRGHHLPGALRAVAGTVHAGAALLCGAAYVAADEGPPQFVLVGSLLPSRAGLSSCGAVPLATLPTTGAGASRGPWRFSSALAAAALAATSDRARRGIARDVTGCWRSSWNALGSAALRRGRCPSRRSPRWGCLRRRFLWRYPREDDARCCFVG